MAEEQEKAPSEVSADEKKLEKWWKDAPNWQKAGVFIGAGALLIALLMYWRSQNQGQTSADTSSSTLPATASTGTYSPVEAAGYGDVWPSLGNLPSTATYTTPTLDYGTTGLTPADTSSFSSSLPTDSSQQWSSPGTTSADVASSQQAMSNAIWGAPTASTQSGFGLGLVATAGKGSIWSQMFGNQNSGTTDVGNTPGSSGSAINTGPVKDVGTTIVPTTSLGSGWNLPTTSFAAPAPAKPSPAQNTQQHVTASNSVGRVGSFKLPAGFHL